MIHEEGGAHSFDGDQFSDNLLVCSSSLGKTVSSIAWKLEFVVGGHAYSPDSRFPHGCPVETTFKGRGA